MQMLIQPLWFVQNLKKKYKDKGLDLPKWLQILDSRVPLPYLHLWLDLGYLRVRTALAYECFENQYYIWVMLEVKIFGKGFEFKLYSPDGESR